MPPLGRAPNLPPSQVPPLPQPLCSSPKAQPGSSATPNPHPSLPRPHSGPHSSSSRAQHLVYPTGKSCFIHHPKVGTSGPPPSLSPPNVGTKFGVFGGFLVGGSWLSEARCGPLTCPHPVQGWAWQTPGSGRGQAFLHAHPLLGLSVQFPVSGKLCFPWVTDD